MGTQNTKAQNDGPDGSNKEIQAIYQHDIQGVAYCRVSQNTA